MPSRADSTERARADWQAGLSRHSSVTGGLASFASYYKAARVPPTIPEGTTVETCTQAQARIIHRLYFELGPGATFADLVSSANKDPAFSKGRDRPIAESHLVELFRGMRESFPWSWRARSATACSHALIDTLLTTPKGTTYGQVTEALKEKHGEGFLHGQALRGLARGAWQDEPTRFPFASRLPKKGKSNFELECLGEPKSIQYDTRGRLLANKALAEKVAAWINDPRFRYEMNLEDFVELVGKDVEGFNVTAMSRLHQLFPEVVPTFEEARKSALERLCVLIHELHSGGLEKLKDVFRVLHEKHGYPMFEPEAASFFRKSFPDLVPNFRESKIGARLAVADELLAAIKKNPNASYTELARKLGLSDLRFRMVMSALRHHDPEALPAKAQNPWTKADIAMLDKVVHSMHLGASQADVLEAIQRDAPELLLRHEMNATVSTSLAIRKYLGIDWQAHQQRKFTEAFVAVVKSSPPGASIGQLARHMAEEHPMAYCPGWIIQLSQEWKRTPKSYPPIGELLDKHGKFPWEYSRIEHSEELARRVGSVIRKHPGRLLREYAVLLHQDPEFAKKYPTFSDESIAAVRSRFPSLVPYVDELKVEGHAAWLAKAREELSAFAKKASKLAKKQESPTILGLANALGVNEGRMFRAIQKHPELFPWYSFQVKGETDLYLATRVAHEMEQAPANATLSDIVKTLRSDRELRKAYPRFGINSFQALRDAYPELVPSWQTRGQILRMKLLVDELLAAPKGAAYAKVVAKARKKHPGVFPAAYDRPEYVQRQLERNGERFPFADALKSQKGRYRLEGQGRPNAVAHSEPSSQLATRLARLSSIPDSLPLLEKIAKASPKSAFDKVEVIAIQHLLDSQVPTFDTYRSLGMSPTRTSVVAVPYSASQAVVDQLEDRGWDVRVPPLDLDAWAGEIREVMCERIEAAEASGRKILVLDDGGLVAKLLDDDPDLTPYAHLFKIVEQTRRGITVADGVELKSPVINVAQSWGKFVEGPMIGDSVTGKLLERLEKIGVESLKGMKVGVIGYGTIGAPIAKQLEERGAVVTVLDVSAESMDKAKADGFAVAKNRATFFSGADMIIGATGMQSMTKADLERVKSGVILGSASSKLVEIDVEALAAESRKGRGKEPRVEVVDGESHPPTVEYTVGEDRKIKLLASGFPVNFDGGQENIPPEQIQLTRALMLIGGLQAVGAKVAGVNRLDPKKELDVLELLESLGVTEEQPEVAEALEKAKLNLEVARHRPGAAYRRHGA